jgi:hypothetical protein
MFSCGTYAEATDAAFAGGFAIGALTPTKPDCTSFSPMLTGVFSAITPKQRVAQHNSAISNRIGLK